MIPVQQYTFLIPAGGAVPLQCMGRYFRIQSATGAVKVTGDNFGNMGTLSPGQGLRMREKDQPFQRLTFIDASGAGNNVTVIVADSDFIDNTLLGTVSVVDGGKSRTLAGGAYSGVAVAPVAAAGQRPRSQLWNPSTTKRLVVSQVLPGSSFANTLYGVLTNVALANAAGAPFSKLAGGAAGVAQFFQDSTLAAIPQASFALSVAAGTVQTYKLTEPLVIPPGWGVNIMGSGLATDCYATFEHYEELLQ